MNKAEGLARLKAKLCVVAEEMKMQQLSEIKGNQVEATFGAQIRSYVMQPYKIVKDARTAYQTSQVQELLDGNLDGFVSAYLNSIIASNTKH